MEIKRKLLLREAGKRRAGSLLAFVLAFGLIAVTPGLSGEAQAVDFDKKCSLTVAPVDPANAEMAADLAQADVVIDLYKVADAAPVEDADIYTYKFLNGYEALGEIYNKDPNNADWREMAQKAAAYALDNGTAARAGAAVNSTIGDLECGLYLLIARGNGIENYRTTVRQEDGGENIATVADSGEYSYTFLPELISLPGKLVQNADGTTGSSMMGDGEWQYNMNVSMKPSQDIRYGSIEIVKTLESYENSQPATFVFQVEAVLNGESVRSTVVSVNFTEAGQKSVVVDRIPIGAAVTVTEVYSGFSYQATSALEQNVTIESVDIIPVAFANDYKESDHGGGSVTNHFSYDEVNGQWGWTKVQDSAGGE